jgi:hypothetical protein
VTFCGEIGDNALILQDCDVFQGEFHKFRLICEKKHTISHQQRAFIPIVRPLHHIYREFK